MDEDFKGINQQLAVANPKAYKWKNPMEEINQQLATIQKIISSLENTTEAQ